VDFGGSLGSAYWQHRRFLDPLDVRWAVVEQPHFVARGRERFTDARLSFHETTAAARAASGAQLLLLSSVLQYLERPYDALAQFIDEGFPFVLIDRTPLLADRDRLTVQRVPRWIYPASYPCWFLSRARLLAAVAPRYEVVAEFPALDRATIPGSTFRGMLLERRGRAAASA
jgi:putative methyltransferase (TIGR04325 family)